MTCSFEDDAELRDRARPGYPPALVEPLVEPLVEALITGAGR
ncbi:hypothetical protein [Streptomyces sp. NPDC006446]